MIDKFISITIRPTYEEFIQLKNVIDKVISFMESGKYIVALEKGKDEKYNHYQICFRTTKHIDAVRRKIITFIKPHLTKKTIKSNVWLKVKKHNMKVTLIGYCMKECNMYKTNWSIPVLLEEKRKYLKQKGVDITPTLRKHRIFKDTDFSLNNPPCGRKFCICWNPNCVIKPRRSYVKKPVASGIGEAKGSE